MMNVLKKILIVVGFFVVIFIVGISLKNSKYFKTMNSENSINFIENSSKLDTSLQNVPKNNYIDFLSKIYNIPYDESIKLNNNNIKNCSKNIKNIKSYNYSKAAVKYTICDEIEIKLSMPVQSCIDDKNNIHFIWIGKVINNTLNNNYKFEPLSITAFIDNNKPILMARGAIYITKKDAKKLNISKSNLAQLGFIYNFKNNYYKIIDIHSTI